MIVLIGDSLTQFGFNPETFGWGTLLQYKYIRKLDVLNRGYSGYTTRWYPTPIDLPSDTQLVTLLLGSNDAAIHSVQSVPLEEYSARLEAMINEITSCTRLLLITPPPVKRPDRNNANTIKYRNACLTLAQTHDIPCLDTWELFEISNDDNDLIMDLYFCDGLHLSKEGNQKLFQGVVDCINQYYPELNSDYLDPTFPWWSELAKVKTSESSHQTLQVE